EVRATENEIGSSHNGGNMESMTLKDQTLGELQPSPLSGDAARKTWMKLAFPQSFNVTSDGSQLSAGPQSCACPRVFDVQGDIVVGFQRPRQAFHSHSGG
ncbi:hypothetical protein BaRGS_00004253, partial [Batillaria attramentaria]